MSWKRIVMKKTLQSCTQGSWYPYLVQRMMGKFYYMINLVFNNGQFCWRVYDFLPIFQNALIYFLHLLIVLLSSPNLLNREGKESCRGFLLGFLQHNSTGWQVSPVWRSSRQGIRNNIVLPSPVLNSKGELLLAKCPSHESGTGFIGIKYPFQRRMICNCEVSSFEIVPLLLKCPDYGKTLLLSGRIILFRLVQGMTCISKNFFCPWLLLGQCHLSLYRLPKVNGDLGVPK